MNPRYSSFSTWQSLDSYFSKESVILHVFSFDLYDTCKPLFINQPLSWITLLYETKIMHLNPAVIRSSIGQSLRDFHNWRLSLYLFPKWERYNQMYTLFFLLTEWKQLLATPHGDLNMVNRQLMVKTSVFYTNNRQ